MSRRRSVLLLLLAFAVWDVPARPADACLNDRDSDSLAAEVAALPPPPPDNTADTPDPTRQASGLPNTIFVLTGRFERNPPLYYEMRVKEVTQQLQATPDVLALYDDVAVALDRLERDEEGITWLAKKRAIMDTSPLPSPVFKEAWYRYYANIGTLRIHRWLRAGAKPETIKEARQARAEITKAIEIKPNAHFNREKYQLKAMDWILSLKDPSSTEKVDVTFAKYLRQNLTREQYPQAIEGLSGLVVLGNAWESADVFGALDYLLTNGSGRDGKKTKVGYLAYLRCTELLHSGHKSLMEKEVLEGMDARRYNDLPPPERTAYLLGPPEHRATNLPNVEAKFRELRAASDAYQKNRTDYMMARLKAGRHPDTDPTFWADYRETPPPSLEIPFWDEANGNFTNFLPQLFGYTIAAVLLTTFVGIPCFYATRALRGFLRMRNGRTR